MALNSIATATKYASALDKMLMQEAVTGFFADNVLKAQFIGADTVVIPDVSFVGLGTYDRDDGFPKGKTTVNQTSYTLTMDRGRQLQIDVMDMDEAGIKNLAGQVLGEFVRTEAAPEMDAYNISKLAALAKTRQNTAAFTADTAYADFCAQVNLLHETVGFGEELVAFVDSTFLGALQTSNEVARQITVSDFKKGDVSFKVKTLNDVKLIPVSGDRMRDAYEFNAGSTTTAGGFAPTATADRVRCLIVPKKGASLVKKHEKLRTFTPDQNQDADAYLFNYRVHYDIFVKKSRLDTVRTLVTAVEGE